MTYATYNEDEDEDEYENNRRYISFLESLKKDCTMIETVTNGSRTPVSEEWSCSNKIFKWVTN